MRCASLPQSHGAWERFRQVPFRRKMSENPELLVKVITSEDTACASGAFLYGIVVSKKLGNAVCRNKMKRRVREAFRMISRAFSQEVPLEKRAFLVMSCLVLLKEKALANFPFSLVVEQLSAHVAHFFPHFIQKTAPP